MVAAGCTGTRQTGGTERAHSIRLARSEAPAEKGHGEEDQEGIRQALKWFYGQRAFPRRSIPSRALLRARRQAARLPHAPIRPTSGPGSAPAAGPLIIPSWTSIGPHPASGNADKYSGASPFGGRVTAVAPVGDGTTTYIGTAEGGVWKTTNGGTTWTPIFDGQPSLAIGAITVDPNDSTHVWVGTGEPNEGSDNYYGAGLFESTTSGSSWSEIAGPSVNSVDQFEACDISSIGIKAGDATTIMVGLTSLQGITGPKTCSNRGGLWRSIDGGTSWGIDPVLPGPVSALTPTATATTWYAGIDGSFKAALGTTTPGVFKSTDSGASWGAPLGSGTLPSGTSTGTFGRVSLAAAPSSASTIYAAFENYSDSELKSIWRSTNGGTSWTSMTKPTTPSFCDVGAGGQCFYDMALAVDPSTSTTLYGGGINLFKWTSTTSVSELANGATGIHVDFHALAFDSGGKLWAGNDGGIYRSTSSAVTGFSNLNADLPAVQFYPGTSGTPSAFIGGTQDNGTLSYTGSQTWDRVFGGDGGYSGVDPGTSSTMYASYVEAEVLKSTDGGSTFSDVFCNLCPGGPGDPAEFIAPFVMSPSDASKLYVGTNRLYRSKNTGTSFSSISPAFTTGGTPLTCCITAIGPAPSDSAVLYVGTGGGKLEVTTDANAAPPTWTNTQSNGLPGHFVTDVVVDPTDPATAYVTVSGFGTGHVFKTVDSGTTWTDVSGDLPDVPVNAVAVDWSATPPALYAGTDAGVLSSTDGGSTWATYGTGLPPVVVMDLQIDTVSATLIAATHGRGAYTIPVASFVANPGRTSFSASNFSVNESAGTARITVTRTGGTSNPASVDFATTGGTATPGTDYSVTPGTLSWAAGEGGTKTFTVSIVNDTTQEPNETVNFSLSNPVGAALGPTTAATLTINDNDKASYRPDLRIKGSSYIGDNVYNTTGAKQTITVTGKRGTKKTFYFILQNDGAKGDWFKITGTGNSTGFKVAYYQGSSLITTGALKAVLGSASSLVPPGAMSVAVKIVVTVLSSAPHGSTKTVTITAISQKQTTKKDVAKAKTKVP